MTADPLVLGTFFLLFSSVCGGEDVVWYIDASSVESAESCGHEPSRPCGSLGIVFQQSLLVNESSSCFTSLGDQDGRASTTVYLTGSAFVPAVCLHNWHNLHVFSYPPGTVTSSIASYTHSAQMLQAPDRCTLYPYCRKRSYHQYGRFHKREQCV